MAGCPRAFHAAAAVAAATVRKRAPTAQARRGRVEDVAHSMRQNQYVLDNFEVPGRYKKFLTGKARKREAARWARRLAEPGDGDGDGDGGDLVRVAARAVVEDEDAQRRRAEMLRGQILRILEAHLAAGQLPTRLLSLQHWRITHYHVRRAVRESAAYLTAVVARELARGAARSIGAPRAVRLRFVNGAVTPALEAQMQAEIQAHGLQE
ncbi:hypothetical protein H4R18_005164 [Coemansia javaensis]|uniref:Uncharacterized protein n=1 Tax=Coemansia javaensis TaxID=2761396 RepID=A0A9W8LG02_9FUNG|nr:hypothetical protein H4R18_005164 [Coemansia javaensis]